MRGWKWLQRAGGKEKKLTKVNICTFFLVFILNGITSAILGDELVYYLTYSLPFLVLAIGSYFIKNNKVYGIIYLIIGLALIFTANKGEFSGALFIIYGLYLVRNKNIEISTLIIMLIAIPTSSLISQRTPFQTTIITIIYAYIYLIYFFTIRADQKKLNNPILTFPNIYLLPNEKELIRLLFLGHTRQEIYGIMNKSKNTITGYQNSIMGKCHVKTFEECLLKLGKSVKIDVISNVNDK